MSGAQPLRAGRPGATSRVARRRSTASGDPGPARPPIRRHAQCCVAPRDHQRRPGPARPPSRYHEQLLHRAARPPAATRRSRSRRAGGAAGAARRRHASRPAPRRVDSRRDMASLARRHRISPFGRSCAATDRGVIDTTRSRSAPPRIVAHSIPSSLRPAIPESAPVRRAASRLATFAGTARPGRATRPTPRG